MEVERPFQVIADVEKSTPKFKERIIQLKEIFKARDVQVPRHEPYQGSTTTATISTIEGRSSTSDTPSLTSSSLASSGLVDIGSHRGLQVGSNCYMLPTMSVPDEHLQSWESEIRSRLEDDLSQWLRTERCHLEFSMVSSKGRIRPCIMVVCWDDSTCVNEKGREIMRRKLQKQVRKLQSLRNCRFPCMVIVDKFHLLAFTSSSPTRIGGPHEIECSSKQSYEDILFGTERNRRATESRPSLSNVPVVSIYAQLSKAQTTFVSLSIRSAFEHGQGCTLGGIIVVGKTRYGLTVAHPFTTDKSNERDLAFAPLAAELEASEESDSDGSLFSEFGSDRTSMFVGNLDQANSILDPESDEITNTPDLANPAAAEPSSVKATSNTPVFSIFGTIFASSLEPKLFSGSDDSSVQCDWALVTIDPQYIALQNSYVRPWSSTAVEVKSILQEKPDPGLEVLILGGRSGVQECRIGQENIRIKIRGRDFVVTQLILTKALGKLSTPVWRVAIMLMITEPGNSGSGVVIDDKVVGCVVGGREILPVAYMIAITSIFEDISSALLETEVRIWENNNMLGQINSEPSTAPKTSIDAAGTLPDHRVTKVTKAAEEQRKKEIEEDGFNANNDSTLRSEMTEIDSAFGGRGPTLSTPRKPMIPLSCKVASAGTAKALHSRSDSGVHSPEKSSSHGTPASSEIRSGQTLAKGSAEVPKYLASTIASTRRNDDQWKSSFVRRIGAKRIAPGNKSGGRTVTKSAAWAGEGKFLIGSGVCPQLLTVS
jgi:hypothetical protein